MLCFPKFQFHKIATVKSSMIFNKGFFTDTIQYLFSIISESLLLFKSLKVTNVEVPQLHGLINSKKEKTLQWSYNVMEHGNMEHDKEHGFNN